MILSRHYLVCLFNIIRLAISFCESVSSCLYAFSHICLTPKLAKSVIQNIQWKQNDIFPKS